MNNVNICQKKKSKAKWSKDPNRKDKEMRSQNCKSKQKDVKCNKGSPIQVAKNTVNIENITEEQHHSK